MSEVALVNSSTLGSIATGCDLVKGRINLKTSTHGWGIVHSKSNCLWPSLSSCKGHHWSFLAVVNTLTSSGVQIPLDSTSTIGWISSTILTFSSRTKELGNFKFELGICCNLIKWLNFECASVCTISRSRARIVALTHTPHLPPHIICCTRS